MIIRRVELSNFGIYGGKHSFDLTPEPLNNFNRPIILVSGKNGAGKTTLVEAIRLCLHGSLALGNRVSRAAYEDHLVKLIYAPLNSTNRPNSTRITLFLDYVNAGRKHTYRIERSWRRNQEKVKEELQIWEDNQPLTDLDTIEQKESFLKELVPPGVADLFFFDGEKLRMLAQDGTSSSLLADTVKTLFGLNLVEQLQKDLDIYLSRQLTNHSTDLLQTQLQELSQKKSGLKNELSILQTKQQTNRETIANLQRAIAEQEQRIASEGGWFAERLDDLKKARQKHEAEIEVLRRHAQDLANGLLPFAVTPRMCHLVAERLQLEEEYEKQVTSQQELERQIARLAPEITSPDLWAEVGIVVDEAGRRKILSRIEVLLRGGTSSLDIDAKEVILQVSDQDRRTLLAWIDQSSAEVPQEFCRTINRLDVLENKLERIERELQQVPADETLSPLVETLHHYNQEWGALQKTDEDLAEEISRSEYELEQIEYQLRRVRQGIADREQHNQRIQLAAKTQLVLEEYAHALGREKLARLEKTLAARFNDLCRKETLIDNARIDPDTFEVTLYRQGEPFEHKQLSAGEKQLLAVATMWALREVSNVPIPIIVDTPLGRLDTDHRFSMVHNYFPQASHQVILLATDAELDGEILTRLAPVVSRIYQLNYDPTQGKTDEQESSFAHISPAEGAATE
jgi:DNA sulfur modification protein DndD